ncbi:MAG TPA: class I SAM-dependent methyltransferase [Terriglobales bacterium]|nr:class I SAM-dependent methyltransferase [Terriglobales bacterium]
MGRFASTIPFYTRYREPYPPAFFDKIASELPLSGKERLLDVACGPGLLALGLAPFVSSCTGLDPEPAMLTEAGNAAKRAGVHLKPIEGKLEEFTPPEASYDVITIGRALHWIDRDRSLPVFDRIVASGGHILVCRSVPSNAPMNSWVDAYKRVRQAFSVELDDRRYEKNPADWFAGSRFRELRKILLTTKHQITVSDLIGRALSYSMTCPAVLGDRRQEFETALVETLGPLSKNETIEEEILTQAVVFR